MKEKEYQQQLEKLSIKIDKNSSLTEEILSLQKHNMFIERGNVSSAFIQTFESIKDEFAPFEKVDLIDYWKWEHERRNQTR